MGLFQKLDMWSIVDELDKMTNYDINGNVNDSPYYDFYQEQILELSNISADMSEELLYKIRAGIHRELPCVEYDFYNEDKSRAQTEVTWFNTAACMLSDVDMKTLLENEDIYEYSDIALEKSKRIRALEKLTKKQQMFLYTEVVGFIMRFLQLKAAFDVITFTIAELDYHQSFIIKKDGVVVPKAAYV